MQYKAVIFDLFETITTKRIQTKSDCFNYILPEVFDLLEQL